MSRTIKDVRKTVLAKNRKRGWRMRVIVSGEHRYEYASHPMYCGCGGNHSPGRDMLRAYWSSARRRAKDALAAGHEPEPARPRHRLQYDIH